MTCSLRASCSRPDARSPFRAGWHGVNAAYIFYDRVLQPVAQRYALDFFPAPTALAFAGLGWWKFVVAVACAFCCSMNLFSTVYAVAPA
jgi:hypothetical protein